MDYILLGAIVLIASIGGLWLSLPTDGQINPLAKGGRDTWIAIAVSVGIALGIGALIIGAGSFV